LGDQIKGDEGTRHVSRAGKMKTPYRGFVGKPVTMNHLEDLDIDGRVTLKYI
jgi:hypothetical protein